ncbi:MAG TPA: DUF1570 domain-containing protein, partial [Vicinamibacterales bacterium]|nr:DUF1570 domain-containing protein [Vicinamibacterales bacterium]
VFHEYTHVLLHNGVQGMPVWLNEGLAEYFSTFRLRAGDREALIGSARPEYVGLLRERFVPLADLLSVDHTSPMYNERDRQSIFYAESWALTHYLLVDRQAGKALNAYLEAKDFSPEALASALGTTTPELELELRRYVQHPAFMAVRYALPEKIAVDAPEQARMLDPAEAEARLGELQIRVGRVAEAAPRIEAAVKAGPDVAEAQLALAMLRSGQHRAPDMLEPLEKASSLAPGDYITQYLYALTLMRSVSEEDQGSASAYEKAHAALTKAVAANPQSAAALAWDAYADMALNTRLDEAQRNTERAIQLAPGRLEYRLQLALVFLRRGETQAAGRSLLRSLAAQTFDETVAKQARGFLDRIAERERTGGPLDVAPPRGPSRVVEVGPTGGSAVDHPDSGSVEFNLRKVQPGEERVSGALVAVDCGPAGVRFHVRLADKTVQASAARMEDVDLVSFLDDKDFALTCGAHAKPEHVYLTMRGDKAVAVEFLPQH